jgi:hypothetical protein
MNTVDGETILLGAGGLAGLSDEEVTGTEFTALRRSLSRRLRQGYRFAAWPELMRWETRYFRQVWTSVASYVAGDEVFHASSQQYYQALRSSSGQAPADASDVVNDAYWALAATDYNADDYDASVAYAVGDQVYYPTTDSFYQVHTAGVAGTAPTVTATWGILTRFDRYVAFAQTGRTVFRDVTGVTRLNPKFSGGGLGGSLALPFWISENGVQVNEAVASVVIEWRLSAPQLTGSVWDEDKVYASGDQVYFTDPDNDFVGNFFTCNATTTAGQNPRTTSAKWDVVELPQFLERFLIQALYADWLKGDRQTEKAVLEEGAALQYLAEERMFLEGQQEQDHRPQLVA